MTALHHCCGLQQQQQQQQYYQLQPMNAPSYGALRGKLQCWQQQQSHKCRSLPARPHTHLQAALLSHGHSSSSSSSSSSSKSWRIGTGMPHSATVCRPRQHTIPTPMRAAAAAAGAPAAAAVGAVGAVAGGLLDGAAVSAAAAASFKLLFLCGVVAWLSHR
jgi:hypothetical protein